MTLLRSIPAACLLALVLLLAIGAPLLLLAGLALAPHGPDAAAPVLLEAPQ